MQIGELAERADVNVQTVRYYERCGLLAEADREPSGYRKYAEADLLRLRFILRAKTLGFTLAEIKELVDLRVDPRRTAEDVRRHAEEKIADVEEKIRDLRAVRRALQQLVASCDAHGSPHECALMHAIGADGDLSQEGAGNMIRKQTLKAVIAAVGISVTALAAPAPAAAHCDSMAGPVVEDARVALAAGDVTPVLRGPS